MTTPRNVVLAGPMGSGKTAVGRLLATWLDRPFVDTDTLIASATGKSVAAVFREDGEPAFRALEADAITAVSERDGLVVAVGGGAVTDPANAEKLREHAHVVVLDASAETLAERVGGGRRAGERRPLLDGADDVAERLENLRHERAGAYADVAHLRVDTTGKAIEHVAAEVAAWLEQQR